MPAKSSLTAGGAALLIIVSIVAIIKVSIDANSEPVDYMKTTTFKPLESTMLAELQNVMDDGHIRLKQAQHMNMYMNSKASPCNDFYQYACGNFHRIYRVPKGEVGIDVTSIAEKDVSNELKAELESINTNQNTHLVYRNPIIKAKLLYDSCLHTNELDEEKLFNFIRSFTEWPLLNENWNPKNFNMISILNKMAQVNCPVLISQKYLRNTEMDTNPRIAIGQPIKVNPLKQILSINRTNSSDLKKYKQNISKVLELLSTKDNITSKVADEILYFEEALTKIEVDVEKFANSIDSGYQIEFTKLKENFSGIDWELLVSTFQGKSIESNQYIVIYSEKYLHDLIELLNRTESRIVANYFLWKLSEMYSSHLNKDAEQKNTCFSITRKYIGKPLEQFYYRKYVNPIVDDKIGFTVYKLKLAFRENLKQVKWLNRTILHKTLEKIDDIQIQIGPNLDAILDESLTNRYKNYQIHPRNYFDNIIEVNRYAAEDNKFFDELPFGYDPVGVRVHYDFIHNKLYLPVGILQPPFYKDEFPQFLRFGALGTEISRSISHALDLPNLTEDGFSSDDETVKEFEKRKDCFKQIVGKQETVDAVILEVAAVKASFNAYKNWLKTALYGAAIVQEHLEGLGITSYEQLFFLSYAQTKCGVIREKSTQNEPSRKIINTLSNINEFATTFQCDQQSRMNSQRNCLIW